MQPDPPGDEAIAAFARATALLDKRDISAAIELFNQAQGLGYPAHECAASRWFCWMLMGEFERAWLESDFISTLNKPDPNRLWNGTPWQGKRVMLRCLHGLGDTIQFIRYAPILRNSCAELIVQTHPQLVRLLSRVCGVDRALTWEPPYSEDVSRWDVQMEINELPRIFRTSGVSIPSKTPYINIPAEYLSAAASQFTHDSAPRIGLVWQASSWDESRSLTLAALLEILPRTGFTYYCLQKGTTAESLPERPLVQNIQATADDVLEYAALMTHLDLVISVDTLAAHLAGAMAKPVWILLSAKADWRWMTNTPGSPWYPTARLFRQKCLGDWSHPLAEISKALQSFQCATSL